MPEIKFNLYDLEEGAISFLQTLGSTGSITLDDANSVISTTGEFGTIHTTGASAHIYTANPGAYIQSRSTFKLFNGTHTTTISHSPTANRAITFANADGVTAVTADSAGRPNALFNGTISGTLTINSTTISFGAGAAANFRTAISFDPTVNSLIAAAPVNSATITELNAKVNYGDLLTPYLANVPGVPLQLYVDDLMTTIDMFYSLGFSSDNYPSWSGSFGAYEADLIYTAGQWVLSVYDTGISMLVYYATATTELLPWDSEYAGYGNPWNVTMGTALPIFYNTYQAGSRVITNGDVYVYTGTWSKLVQESSFDANIPTFLEFPNSDNLAAALTDAVGTGGGFVRSQGAVFDDIPTLTDGSVLRSEKQFARKFSDVDITYTGVGATYPSEFDFPIEAGKTYRIYSMMTMTGQAGSTHSLQLVGTFNVSWSNGFYRRAGFESMNFLLGTTPMATFGFVASTGTTSQTGFMEGFFTASTSGTLRLSIASGSGSASVTLLKNSFYEIQEW